GACLGARAWDQGAGLALDAPPLKPAQYAALLPGAKNNSLLGWLVARHLQSDFQVRLRLDLAVQPETRLSAGAGQSPHPSTAAELPPRLGLSTWLCSAGASVTHYQPANFLLSTEEG
ncbi:type VI secretion system baseplate subunit TssG, partial [Rugamonas sp. FT82W]